MSCTSDFAISELQKAEMWLGSKITQKRIASIGIPELPARYAELPLVDPILCSKNWSGPHNRQLKATVQCQRVLQETKVAGPGSKIHGQYLFITRFPNSGSKGCGLRSAKSRLKVHIKVVLWELVGSRFLCCRCFAW